MDIRVYNRFLDLQFEISRYQSLQFKRSCHSIGDFELHINRYSHGAIHLDKGHLISLGKQDNKVGIILSKEIALDEKGKESENMKFVGLSLDALMLRRITVPPSHTSHDRVNGSAEFVMKHYVYNNFINTESHRVLPNFEIADNQSRGNHISYESRYKVVADELENISIDTGLGWGVTADFKAKKFIFDVHESKDLTPDNRQGNNPVFFSPEYESIESQSFVDNDLDLRNVGYVGGQGEGAERKIVTVGDVSGWDRIETFVDARDVSDEDEETEEELTDEEVEKLLIERGKKKMRDMETIFSLEAKISTPITRKSYENNHEGYRHPAQPVQGQTVKKEVITPFEYEKDFDLGDRVEVRNLSWNLTMEAPITELIEIYEGDGFKLEATFGRSRPTLISKLKDKFDELEGIEKQEAPEQVSVRRMNEAKEFAKKEDVYVREDAKEFADTAEGNANKYTNEVDTKNREFTNYLMDAANREIEDTKRRLDQAVEDLGAADESIKKALEEIDRIEEEIENLPGDSHEELEELREKVKEAQDRIDSVTEDKDGQTVLKGTLVTNEIIAENTLLTGTFRGPKATIEELTTKDMHALRAIIEDAIVKGRLDAKMATMLGLTTEEMIALNAIIQDAIIQDATIKGTLNTNEAIFQKGRFNEAIIVDAKIENADVSGRLLSPTGKFSGSINAPDLIIENPNAEQEGQSTIKLQLTEDTQGGGSTPYNVLGYTRFYSSNGGLSIDKEDNEGAIVPLRMLDLNSEILRVFGQLQIGAGGTSGSDYGIGFPNYHSIGVSPTQNDSFTVWGNRQGGARPFLVRSHNLMSGYGDDMFIGGSTRALYIPPTYDQTSSNPANVRIGQSGQLYRTSCSKKYKVLIEPSKVNPYNIHKMQVSDWYDKPEVERLAHAMHLEYKGEECDPDIAISGAKRVTGLIAEDAVKAGLEMFVEYNSEGDVEGLQDNRLLTLLIPISKDHDDMLKSHDEKLNDHDDTLEHILSEMKQLKEENETLKAEIEKLKEKQNAE